MTVFIESGNVYHDCIHRKWKCLS